MTSTWEDRQLGPFFLLCLAGNASCKEGTPPTCAQSYHVFPHVLK